MKKEVLIVMFFWFLALAVLIVLGLMERARKLKDTYTCVVCKVEGIQHTAYVIGSPKDTIRFELYRYSKKVGDTVVFQKRK